MTELVQRMGAGVARQDGAPGEGTIEDLLGRQQAGFARVLPASMSPERFARLVLTECRKNPGLLRCSPISLLGASMTAAQLGLEPGPLQHCYLVPRKGEVTFQLGYRGMIELALRGGGMLSIDAHLVGANDEFEFAYGTDAYLHHVPALDDPGEPRCVYAVARLREGGTPFAVLSLAEVDRRRRRSSAPDSPAWRDDFSAMARKTAIRALEPFLPKSAELAVALKLDEQVRTDWAARLDESDPSEGEAASAGELPPVDPPVAEEGAADVGSEAGAGSGDASGDPEPPVVVDVLAELPSAVEAGADGTLPALWERLLEAWPASALQSELRSRGKKVSGSRAELIARLEEDAATEGRPGPVWAVPDAE